MVYFHYPTMKTIRHILELCSYQRRIPDMVDMLHKIAESGLCIHDILLQCRVRIPLTNQYIRPNHRVPM